MAAKYRSLEFLLRKMPGLQLNQNSLPRASSICVHLSLSEVEFTICASKKILAWLRTCFTFDVNEIWRAKRNAMAAACLRNKRKMHRKTIEIETIAFKWLCVCVRLRLWHYCGVKTNKELRLPSMPRGGVKNREKWNIQMQLMEIFSRVSILFGIKLRREGDCSKKVTTKSLQLNNYACIDAQIEPTVFTSNENSSGLKI